MAIFNEQFARCKKCDHGWFQEVNVVMIHKDSEEDEPVVLTRVANYVCQSCGELQFVKKE